MTTSCIEELHISFNRAVGVSDLSHHDEALKVLATITGSSTVIMNARAVCLLRNGQTAAALRLLRSFVLQSGCTWMKTELPPWGKSAQLSSNGEPQYKRRHVSDTFRNGRVPTQTRFRVFL